jgi:hypothetical protein
MRSSDYKQIFVPSDKPKLFQAIRKMAWSIYIIISLPIIALVFSFLNWVIPSPPLTTVFQWLLFLIGIVIIVGVLISFILYIIDIYRYIGNLENNLIQVRKLFLASAGIGPFGQNHGYIYSIVGIAENLGSVNMIIEFTESSGLRAGSVLDVITSATDEIWGSVRVSHFENDQVWLEPSDRRNHEFWEMLEDRMKTDQSPPKGVHLEPHLVKEVRDLFNSSKDQ